MKKLLYALLLACLALLGGCSQSKQIPKDLAGEREPSEIVQCAEDTAPEKAPAEMVKIPGEGLVTEQEPPGMIQIENLTVTDNTLTLDYRVSNPFQDDIRVCHDRAVYGKQDVQHAKTRIHGETVWIMLGDNVISGGFPNPLPVAKYVRLAPGESYSGKILLDLPIRDQSPDLWSQRRGKEHREAVLGRAVFEVDYREPNSNQYFDSVSERRKMKGTEPKLTVVGPYYYLSHSPTITEETVDGKLREVIYVEHSGAPPKNEESAQVVITDVAIPCSIVVDDE